jgi:hypothetical protein
MNDKYPTNEVKFQSTFSLIQYFLFIYYNWKHVSFILRRIEDLCHEIQTLNLLCGTLLRSIRLSSYEFLLILYYVNI